MASKAKFYAVKKGKNPGIYTTWNDCNNQVQGFKGNQYKSFNSRAEAEQYLGGYNSRTSGPTVISLQPTMSKPKTKRQKSPVLVRVKRKCAPSNTPRPSRTDEAVSSQPPCDLSRPLQQDQNAADIAVSREEDVYQVEYDGASKSNPGPAGAGALVRRPDGSVVCELREGLGSATNNVAEYRAFILGLRGALDRGIYRVRVQGDSKLVCEQVSGRWKVNQPTLAVLCKEAQKLIQNFSEFSVRHVERALNSDADQLANEAVALPETTFLSSFESTTAETRDGFGPRNAIVLGDRQWRQGRGCKTYGAFDFLQTSQLRLACKSYCLGFRPPSMAGAQGLRNTHSPFKGNRPIVLVTKPRVSSSGWIVARCFTSISVRETMDQWGGCSFSKPSLDAADGYFCDGLHKSVSSVDTHFIKCMHLFITMYTSPAA